MLVDDVLDVVVLVIVLVIVDWCLGDVVIVVVVGGLLKFLVLCKLFELYLIVVIVFIYDDLLGEEEIGCWLYDVGLCEIFCDVMCDLMLLFCVLDFGDFC